MFGTTPAERTTPRSPVTLSGTWFGRVGLRPYELLGLTEQSHIPPNRRRELPRIAAPGRIAA